MYKRVSRLLHILLLVIWLGTCGSTIYFINDEPVGVPPTMAAVIHMPVPTTPPTLAPTLEPVPKPDPDWTVLQPGLESRVIPIYDGQNLLVESVHVWRLDQRYFELDVAYDSRPKSLDTWQRETDALIVVNGGYYSIENERYFPDGLTIVDGIASGRSFNGFGGMLAIDDSRAELRWLAQEPYNANESINAALQCFPILVEPGGVLGFGAERESHVNARRTVIAQDRDGRILFLIAPLGHFTLHQLSVWLTESDLNLDIAINLDGGGSTGILVTSPYELIPPTRPIPFVILVHAR